MSKVNNTTALQVGSILVASWGYDQTNVDFYQVLAVKNKTVSIAKIAATATTTSGHGGTKLPLKDNFTGPQMSKRIRGNDAVLIESYIAANPWNGKPTPYTSY